MAVVCDGCKREIPEGQRHRSGDGFICRQCWNALVERLEDEGRMEE